MKTYFLKEQEYAIIESPFTHSAGLQQVLNRLRGSPFFDNTHRPEYDALSVMVSMKKKELKCEELKCEELIKTFPMQDFKSAFSQCWDDKQFVEIEEAADGLERKL